MTDEILVYNETDDVAYYVNTDFSNFILDSGYKKIQIIVNLRSLVGAIICYEMRNKQSIPKQQSLEEKR